MCCDLSTYDQYLVDTTEQSQFSQSQKSTFTVLRSVPSPFEKSNLYSDQLFSIIGFKLKTDESKLKTQLIIIEKE
jgi:hypothetical protein